MRCNEQPSPTCSAQPSASRRSSTRVRLTGIVRRLFERLTGRVETVNAALVTLASQLAGGDPTVGPDALRAGDQAVLPPDPMRNPAHRTDRDNRALLAADLHSDDPARIRFAMSILESLQRAGDRTGVVQLVVYDSAAFRGQGRAAISVGDLTTAANVAVVVPGITNSPSSMSGGLDLAADLREEADRQAPKEQTAVVAWYGYDIPASWTKDPGTSISTDVADTIAAGSAANAASGAPVLASDLSKIKAMSQTSERISLLGFSMGSTTVSEAAQFTLPVDSVVLMGSPGAGWNTETASGYRNVPESGVFVLSYDQDPVTLPVTDHLASDALGLQSPFGPDPAANTFGGKHIDVDSNVPLVTADRSDPVDPSDSRRSPASFDEELHGRSGTGRRGCDRGRANRQGADEAWPLTRPKGAPTSGRKTVWAHIGRRMAECRPLRMSRSPSSGRTTTSGYGRPCSSTSGIVRSPVSASC